MSFDCNFWFPSIMLTWKISYFEEAKWNVKYWNCLSLLVSIRLSKCLISFRYFWAQFDMSFCVKPRFRFLAYLVNHTEQNLEHQRLKKLFKKHNSDHRRAAAVAYVLAVSSAWQWPTLLWLGIARTSRHYTFDISKPITCYYIRLHFTSQIIFRQFFSSNHLDQKQT